MGQSENIFSWNGKKEREKPAKAQNNETLQTW
jgi:hypothetical protein